MDVSLILSIRVLKDAHKFLLVMEEEPEVERVRKGGKGMNQSLATLVAGIDL